MPQIDKLDLVNFFIQTSKLQNFGRTGDGLSWTELQREEKESSYRKELNEKGNNFLNSILTIETCIREISNTAIFVNLPELENKIPYTRYGIIDDMYDYSKVDLYSLPLIFLYQTEDFKNELLTYSSNQYAKITGKVSLIVDSHNNVLIGSKTDIPCYVKYGPPYRVHLELVSIEKKEMPQVKGDCFIATAVYNNYDCQEVLVLREFRDKYLLVNPLGKMFVRIYYKISPSIARQIVKSEKSKFLIKKLILSPLINRLKHNSLRK